MSTVADLNALLVKARDAYYNGDDPILTDDQYDAKEAELKALVKANPALASEATVLKVVGNVATNNGGRIPHVRPMLSIENYYTKPEIGQFFTKNFPTGYNAMVEPKRDGISCELRYHNRQLTLSLTRSDGVSGEDMTAQVKVLRNVPQVLKDAHLENEPVNIHLRGELVMRKSELDRINAEITKTGGKLYMSTRNLTAGTMKQKDLSVVASRDIVFIPWDVYSPDQDDLLPESGYRRMLLTEAFGFPKYEGQLVFNEVGVLRALDDVLVQNEKSDVVADGVVIKADSVRRRAALGVGSTTTNWQVCFKPQNAGAETTLEQVIWSNGRTGKLTPVAICSPVVLAGAVVTRANINNLTWVNNLGLTLGARVKILRSGDVIPIIVEAITKTDKPILPPVVCPDCGHDVIENESDAKILTYECGNASCPGTLAHHLYAIADRDTLEIDALGPELADELVTHKYVNNVADLVEFANDIAQSLKVRTEASVLASVVKTGHFRSGAAVVKMAKSMQKAKTADWNRWIASLGIPMIGHSLGKVLAQVLSLKNTDFGTLCAKFIALPDGTEGFGPKKKAALLKWAKDPSNQALCQTLFTAGVRPKPQLAPPTGPLSGLTFCITGEFWTSRDAITKHLVDLGATAKSGVSKKTNLLLVGQAPGKTKQDDAAKHGVQTVGADWLRATFIKYGIEIKESPKFEVEDAE